MNIKVSYLYRDGANYKNFNEVIFRNPNNLSLEIVEEVIKKNLIDGQWFVAKEWGLPDLHFKEYIWDSEIDHEWHEFESIEETMEFPSTKNNIEDLILLVRETKLPW